MFYTVFCWKMAFMPSQALQDLLVFAPSSSPQRFASAPRLPPQRGRAARTHCPAAPRRLPRPQAAAPGSLIPRSTGRASPPPGEPAAAREGSAGAEGRRGPRGKGPQCEGGEGRGEGGGGRGGARGGTYQSVCGSSMTRSSLNFLPAAEETADEASTRPAEAAVCFTALDRELKKLLPVDCCGGGGCCCWGGGGCRRSAAGEAEAGAAEAEGGGGCCGSGRCRSVM